MPITRYYPSTTEFAESPPPPSYVPITENSTAFPWGSDVSGSLLKSFSQMSTTKPSTEEVAGVFGSYITRAQTTRQSAWFGTLYYRLGAQTIPSGTWSFATVADSSNTAANPFWGVSIYVWRPSTSTVVGYITDQQLERGTEWPTTAASVLFSVTSNVNVTAQDQDVLIVELWYTALQSMVGPYEVFGYIPASVSNPDFTTTGTAAGNFSGWVDAPDTLIPYADPTAYQNIFYEYEHHSSLWL